MQQKAQITSQQLRKAQLQVLVKLPNEVEAGMIVTVEVHHTQIITESKVKW